MNKIKQIYSLLLKEFGQQGWWPVTEEGKLHPEYSGGPKNEKQQLEVIFGSILTQNTSWKNVEKAIKSLNKNKLIDVYRIIKIKNEKLAEIIKSSGYHNQKAKKLKNFCEFLLKKHDGKLELFFNQNIKDLRNELLSVNGIGPETADSIILFAAKKPIFVIDAYTKRIFQRIGCKEETYDDFQELFTQSLPHNERLFNEYHALIVELGKNHCRKVPVCINCPLKRFCSHCKKNQDGI